jgi:hypothetical protein
MNAALLPWRDRNEPCAAFQHLHIAKMSQRRKFLVNASSQGAELELRPGSRRREKPRPKPDAAAPKNSCVQNEASLKPCAGTESGGTPMNNIGRNRWMCRAITLKLPWTLSVSLLFTQVSLGYLQ